jgi:hypothetical protein
MKDMILFEEYWGNLILSVCIGKFDVLPRVTLSAFPRAFIINVGFVFFTLNFTIWDEKMREFNRNNPRNGRL